MHSRQSSTINVIFFWQIHNFRPIRFVQIYFISSNEEGEELYYKRGYDFKLPYPCLYDFENTAFSGSTPISYAETSSVLSMATAAPSIAAISSKSTSELTTLPASSTKTIPTSNHATKGTSLKSTQLKAKSAKHNKAQLIQQRAQQHAQQQLHSQQQQQQRLLQNSNYNLDESVHMQTSHSQMPFNATTAAYSSSFKSNPQEGLIDYYGVSCKSEMIDEASLYDSPKVITQTPNSLGNKFD